MREINHQAISRNFNYSIFIYLAISLYIFFLDNRDISFVKLLVYVLLNISFIYILQYIQILLLLLIVGSFTYKITELDPNSKYKNLGGLLCEIVIGESSGNFMNKFPNSPEILGNFIGRMYRLAFFVFIGWYTHTSYYWIFG